MTREEAIDIIRQYECCKEHCEACEMAIKALSQEPTKEEKALLKKWRDNRGVSMKDFEDAMNALQEPCEDAIDRAEAMTEIMMSKSITAFDRDLWIRTKDAVHILRELPSVTQKSGHWIAHFPDHATNGEVLKALFPNERIGHCEDCTDLGDIATFDDDWWNALYQKGGKE